MQAEKVYNQDLYFKRAVKHVGEPMSHLESIASSAVCCSEIEIDSFLIRILRILCPVTMLLLLIQVRAAIKVKASVIICFTSSGRAARSLYLSPFLLVWVYVE